MRDQVSVRAGQIAQYRARMRVRSTGPQQNDGRGCAYAWTSVCGSEHGNGSGTEPGTHRGLAKSTKAMRGTIEGHNIDNEGDEWGLRWEGKCKLKDKSSGNLTPLEHRNAKEGGGERER